jgi:hypothetical protein
VENAGQRRQNLLTEHRVARGTDIVVPRRLTSFTQSNEQDQGNFTMLRTSVCLAAMLLVAGSLDTASAQTAAPAPAKQSRMKLTVERLKEMRAKWSENKVKLKACRKEVHRQGLVGDDRWFFIEDCMNKT